MLLKAILSRTAGSVVTGLVVLAWTSMTFAQAPASFNVVGPSNVGAAPPVDAVAADFNRDGHRDLLVTAGDKLNILIGDGAGRLTRQIEVSLAFAAGLTVADFNNDGFLDVAVTQNVGTGGKAAADQCGPTPGTAIYLSAAGAALIEQPCLQGLEFPFSVQAGDFTSDTIQDLAVISSQSAGLLIYRGLGSGLFAAGVPVNGGAVPAQDMAQPVDLNGDTFLDLVVGFNAGVFPFVGNGDGTFNGPQNTRTGFNTLTVAVADVNGDERPDLATFEPGLMRVTPGVGNGSFDFGPSVVYQIPGAGQGDLAIEDLNSDGFRDIVVAAGGQVGQAILYAGNGTIGGFARQSMPFMGNEPDRALTGDFNSDGNPDAAIVNFDGQVFVALQNAPERIDPTVEITSPADGSRVSGVVEIRADASDNVGVVRVDFFDGAILIGSDTEAPYSVSWDTRVVAEGSHTLTATAHDAAGNSASDSVTVTVEREPEPEPEEDREAPSAPQNLEARSLGNSRILLDWDAATDNVGVEKYRVYERIRKGNRMIWKKIASTERTRIILDRDDVEGGGRLHTFAVTAVDAAGNESARSNTAQASFNGRGDDDHDDDDHDDDDHDDDHEGHRRRR